MLKLSASGAILCFSSHVAERAERWIHIDLDLDLSFDIGIDFVVLHKETPASLS